MKLAVKELIKVLEEAEFEVSLTPGPKELPFTQILVPLGSDLLGKEMTLQIGLYEGPAPEENPQELQLQFIQYLIIIPARVEEPYKIETHKFLDLLNTVIELPGFGLLDSEHMPYFRYTQVCNHQHIDEGLFLMTVGLIMYMMDAYVPSIQAITTGEKTLSQMAEVAKQAREEDSNT